MILQSADMVRLAVLRDYREENWPSMNLCADMLLTHLPQVAPNFVIDDCCPPYRRRFTRLPVLGESRFALNTDRLLNRFHDYPRRARRIRNEFDVFHVVDHSYAQLVHQLPAEHVGVQCHDLDAFRSLLEPESEPRPAWFRQLMSRVLDGLKRAAVVFYASAEVGRAINAAGICTADRLVYAPYGVAAEFLEKGDDIAPPLPSGPPYLLHVGSCIDRKRVDVLLDVYANLRPGRRLRLVQIGGVWTPAQVEQITRLGIENDVVQLRGLTRRQLAAIYRDAALVLQPSDAEGYGLPVVEALACGANVVVSDIPVLREVGGDVVSFAPVADIAAWNDIASRLLDAPETAPSLEVRRAWAAKFTWEAQARTIAEAYRKLLGG